MKKCDERCFDCEKNECPDHPTEETRQWAETIRRLRKIPDIVFMQLDLLKRYKFAIMADKPVDLINNLCQRLQKLNTSDELIDRAYRAGVADIALFGPQ